MQLLDVGYGPFGLEKRFPAALGDILLGDDSERSWVIALHIDPPTWVENLIGQVGIQGTSNTGDPLTVAVDELNKVTDVFGGTGDMKCPLLVAKVHLHIDDEEMSSGLILGGRREVGLDGLLGKVGNIRVEKGANATGVVEGREAGHFRFQDRDEVSGGCS